MRLTTSVYKTLTISKSKDMPRKIGQFQVQRTRQRKMDMNLGTWNVRILYKPRATRDLISQIQNYKMDILAIQETKWQKKILQI